MKVWGKLAVLAASTLALAMAPIDWALALVALVAVLSIARMRRQHLASLARFCLITTSLSAFFLAAFGPGAGQVSLGPVQLNGTDFIHGAAAGLRLAAIIAVFALARTWLPSRELIPLASRWMVTAYVVGSLMRLIPALKDDARRMRGYQQLRGNTLGRGVRSVRSWIPLLVPLLVKTMRRAREQAMALQASGILDRTRSPASHGRAHFWAHVVALAALAVAGRLALVAVPGVSLGFFILFIAGVAYGPKVGAAVGFTARLSTDLVLSGLHPVLVPMVLVETLLGLVAGLLGRGINFGQRRQEPWTYAALVAGTTGWAFTLFFSVGADTATWLFARWLFPSLAAGGDIALWWGLVIRGVLFNIPSMAFNAALFGIAAYPALRALQAAGLVGVGRPFAGAETSARRELGNQQTDRPLDGDTSRA